MQEFREILETDTVSDSREYINKGLQTLRSNFAGEAFPTENLAVGMKCYRIDKGRTYTLKSLDPLLWEEDGSAVKREDMTNSQLFTEAMTREALKNITDWSHFFSRLPVMEYLDLSPYPIDNATKLDYLFANDFMLKSVTGFEIGAGKEGVQGWASSLVKSFEGMFYRCESLYAFDGEVINTRGVENLKEMFAYCRRLKKLSTGHWIMQQCKTMAGMLKGCEKLEEIDVSKWDVSNVEDFSSLFEGCHKLNGQRKATVWQNGKYTIENYGNLMTYMWATTKAKTMGSMFKNCVNISELDLSKFDMRNVENASRMFQNCYGLQRIACGENTFSTSKVKDFSYMFDGCGLQSLGVYDSNSWKEDWTILSKLDFSSAENMEAMLRNTRLSNEICRVPNDYRFDAFWSDFAQHVLEGNENYWIARSLSLRINAPKVGNIAQMLAGCSVDGIYLEMDTSNVTNMPRLFEHCSATCIRLKGFDTQRSIARWMSWQTKETGIAHMFQGCRSLRFLILDSQEFTFKLEHKDSYYTYTEDIFADLPAECRVLVPKALLPTYRAAPVWKDYADRIEAMEDYEFTGSSSMFVLRRRPTAEEHFQMQDTVTFRKV